MGEYSSSGKSSQSEFVEQRGAQRFMFIAVAELTEPATGAKMSGRLSEISRSGCFIDLLNTLPIDTVVHVRIIRDQGTFSSVGKVVYVQERMGMGIAFQEPTADQQGILDKWIAELSAGG